MTAQTKVKRKWFFPAQEKINQYLREKFGECYRCEFQDVCKYSAYETYQCWKPKEIGKDQEHFRITFIIHKRVTGQNNAPALIEVMEGNYNATMQYFASGK